MYCVNTQPFTFHMWSYLVSFYHTRDVSRIWIDTWVRSDQDKTQISSSIKKYMTSHNFCFSNSMYMAHDAPSSERETVSKDISVNFLLTCPCQREAHCQTHNSTVNKYFLLQYMYTMYKSMRSIIRDCTFFGMHLPELDFWQRSKQLGENCYLRSMDLLDYV